MGCIYRLTNTSNNKIYVGKYQGKNFDAYIKYCFHQAVIGDDTKPYLYNAIRKWGVDAFKIGILINDPALTGKALAEREIFFIAQENSFGQGYNLTIGGDGCNVPGRKWTEEQRLKAKGRKWTEEERLAKIAAIRKFWDSSESAESRKLMSLAKKGKRQSASHIENATTSRRGLKRTEEMNQKQSERSRGDHNPMFGRSGSLNPMYGVTGDRHPMWGKSRPDQSALLKSMKRDVKGRLLPA
jgi:group I intron endonuclease